MTPDQFLGFAQAFTEPMLLINKAGKILAANFSARNKFGIIDNTPVDLKLHELVVDGVDSIDKHLRTWGRSADFTPVKLTIGLADKSVANYHCHGAALRTPLADNTDLIMLRFLSAQIMSKGFVALNEKIAELKKEIVARRKATLDLSHKEAQLQAMINSIPDAIVFVNTQREIIAINPAFEALLGYSLSEIVGKTTELIYKNKEDFYGQGKTRYNLKSKSNPDAYEVEYLGKDGTEFWGETLGTKVVDDTDNVLGFIGIIRDVTQRKQIEEELDNHRAHLEELVNERTQALKDTRDELVRKERLATLGQLTATVSHELRNPLGAMRPSLYVISKKIDVNDDLLVQSIERVERNIDRCDRIIDELLDFTRIAELELRPVDLDKWLKSVLQEQQLLNNLTVNHDFNLAGLEVLIDKHRLRRAVINVVENACHAMFVQGQINTFQQDARLNVVTKRQNDRINITVEDNGSGISDEVLPKIFEPLYSTKGFGVGIGLPTVKQILEQHQGGVEISTCRRKGTSITLWLPQSNVI